MLPVAIIHLFSLHYINLLCDTLFLFIHSDNGQSILLPSFVFKTRAVINILCVSSDALSSVFPESVQEYNSFVIGNMNIHVYKYHSRQSAYTDLYSHY